MQQREDPLLHQIQQTSVRGTVVPPYGGTTYRFTTPHGSTCGQMPVWPGEEAARARHAAYNDTLRAEFSEFDGNIKEINPIQIIVQGAFNDYWELNPDSEVFT